MTRTRRRGVGSSVLVTAAVAACVVVLTGGMAVLGHRVSGTGPRVPEPGPVHSLSLRLTYVGRTPEGPRLFTETHSVPDPSGSTLAVAAKAMMTDWPRDDDYRNYLLASHTHATATARGGEVVVDFADAPRRGPEVDDATARMAIQSVVRTIDDAVGDPVPVRFRIRGEDAPSILGVDTRDVVRPADPTVVDSAVSVLSPGEGAFVSSGSAVRGRASTSDGRVYWAVYRYEGLVLVGHGRSAPGRCCEQTAFTFRLPHLEAGPTYVVVVGDRPDLGGGDTVIDTKQFSVR